MTPSGVTAATAASARSIARAGPGTVAVKPLMMASREVTVPPNATTASSTRASPPATARTITEIEFAVCGRPARAPERVGVTMRRHVTAIATSCARRSCRDRARGTDRAAGRSL